MPNVTAYLNVKINPETLVIERARVMSSDGVHTTLPDRGFWATVTQATGGTFAEAERLLYKQLEEHEVIFGALLDMLPALPTTPRGAR